MKKGPRLKQNKAFTIFEVAMAATVMALVLGSSLTVMGRNFAMLDNARATSYASQVMQSELEKMRLHTPWGNGTTAGTGTPITDPITGAVTTGVTCYATALTNVPIDTTFLNAGDMASRMTLQRIASDVLRPDGTVHSGMIQITLKITWTTLDRHRITRSYTTYYAKNGLYDFFNS